MRLSRNLDQYVVRTLDPLKLALDKINNNKSRQVFVTSFDGELEGILTDGDFRRWIISTAQISLELPVSEAMNSTYVSALFNNTTAHIESLFSNKIMSVPLLDSNNRLVAIAWKDDGLIRMGDVEIGNEQPAFIIAEIGNNHNGNITLAKHLIDLAVESGANCAKFQLRDFATLYQDLDTKKATDLGAEYTEDLLRRFQLNLDQILDLMQYTEKSGLTPLCTPWDNTSLMNLDANGAIGFKIASADLTNHDLLIAAAKTAKPLIVSTGMSLEHEIKESVAVLKSHGADFALLHCNSTYPTPMQDINLGYMKRLQKIGGGVIGYSGHERGYEVCIAAVANGAKIIEKHLTVDRKMEGTDHRVSLLPDEFAQMVKAIRNVEDAMGSNLVRTMSQGEKLNREVLAKSLTAKYSVKSGHTLTRKDIAIKSPGQGLQPSHLKNLIGVTLSRDVLVGEPFFETDIKGSQIKARSYQFNRLWGIPIRYHDINALTKIGQMDLLEIHLSYRDLEVDITNYFAENFDCELVVHSPELFSGDHILNLASRDPTYLNRSIAELQTVINHTRQLKQYFPKSSRPMIIINAGGFSSDDFLTHEIRSEMYTHVANMLSTVNDQGVEIIIQTMPPFPWHFGGQSHHNLFVRPEEIQEFCQKYGYRLCYDVSHSKLACNYLQESLEFFTDMVAPYTAHLHIADARNTRDEGLQIGEGEIDFVALWRKLSEKCPNASFIPEVWQGHKNSGEGFWLALSKLEHAFSKSKAH